MTCPEHSGVVTAIEDIKGSLDRIEKKVDKLDNRVWTMALKVAGIAGTVGVGATMAIHAVIAK